MTGHRLHLLPGYTGSTSRDLRSTLLRLAMDKLEEWHPDSVIVGMATGWDMAMAGAAMLLNIPYHCYVPFVGQERRWGDADRSMYGELLTHAESTRVFGPVHSNALYHVRDQAIVDDSTHILALYLGDPATGTGQTLAYAEGWLVPWTNVAEEFLERIQETARRP